MTPTEAFFTVHRDLPREGPGEPDDVRWALRVAGTPDQASICDAACGTGADTVTLAEERPEATVLGVDLVHHFVESARRRAENFGERVRVEERDYSELPGRYDLIWCAGAVYFVGLEAALANWLSRLLPGGAVAFSEPAWVREPPSAEARTFWEEYPAIRGVDELNRRIADAGWQVLEQRWLIGAPWEVYYAPIKERIAELKTGHRDCELTDAISESEAEIARWEAAPDEIAYVLFVVRPK